LSSSTFRVPWAERSKKGKEIKGGGLRIEGKSAGDTELITDSLIYWAIDNSVCIETADLSDFPTLD
jgi:hypothetical protein